MHRKLTITVSDDVYRGLHQKVGRDEISRFIENLVRPHVVSEDDLLAGYTAMAADIEREQEALEWIDYWDTSHPRIRHVESDHGVLTRSPTSAYQGANGRSSHRVRLFWPGATKGRGSNPPAP
jgi:predicted CopG family antitoxin